MSLPFVRYRNCPKQVWLDRYLPEKATNAEDDEPKYNASIITEYARKWLKAYNDARAVNSSGNVDIVATNQNTKQFIVEKKSNICDAVFVYKEMYCIVDILYREDNGYRIYLVLSSKTEKKHHLIELAHQKCLAEKAGISISGCSFLHLDINYVKQGEINIDNLFAENDVTDKVAEQIAIIQDQIEKCILLINKNEEPNIEIGTNCDQHYQCPYFEYCRRNVCSPSIFDIRGLSKNNKYKWYDQGIISYEEVLKSGMLLDEKQKRQVETELFSREDWIDTKNIKDFLTKLLFPLCFLDFEGCNPPIPLYDGCKPFDFIPFQYSIHYIPKEQLELEHKEFLAEEGIDPRRRFAESLVLDIPQNATVVVYDLTMEKKTINKLSDLFGNLAGPLQNISKNIIDMQDIFSKGYYYSKRMNGSFSLKDILPAIFPQDAEMNYDYLKGVKNGYDASKAFLALQYMSEADKEEKRRELLKYCRKDTLGLVKIWRKLHQTVNQQKECQ